MLIIDRFEGELAVCERDDRTFVSLPRADLPPDAREGDCLRAAAGGYAIDRAETARRRAANLELLRRLTEE